MTGVILSHTILYGCLHPNNLSYTNLTYYIHVGNTNGMNTHVIRVIL